MILCWRSYTASKGARTRQIGNQTSSFTLVDVLERKVQLMVLTRTHWPMSHLPTALLLNSSRFHFVLNNVTPGLTCDWLFGLTQKLLWNLLFTWALSWRFFVTRFCCTAQLNNSMRSNNLRQLLFPAEFCFCCFTFPKIYISICAATDSFF